MDRREFLKTGMLAAGAAAISSCVPGTSKKNAASGAGDGEMTYREGPGHTAELHDTGRCPAAQTDKVSLLGYGCMRWPMKKDGDGNDVPDQEMINTLVDKAIEKGVNYFDSSPVYHSGLSERVTGIALSRHDRSEYLVATKLSNFDPRTHSREASMAMYENSFKELQVDYIDYYLLHSLGGSIENFEQRYIANGMLDFLMEERRKGRIRHLGYSFHGNRKMFDYFLGLHEKYHWDFVQIQMNYSDWNYAVYNNKRNTDASYMYEELSKRGIKAVIMEPLLGGRLARVPQAIAERLQRRDPMQSIASWAFRFCGTFPDVLCVLSGMTYMEHLDDNIRTFSPLKVLAQDDLAFLDNIAMLMSKYPTVPCNDCKYCIPCPYGIDIPGILQHYNKCVNEGDIAADTMDPNYRRARRRYLASYNRAVPDMRQADKCIGCGQCVEKCPQSIDIPHELRKIDIYVEDLRRNAE